MCDPSDFTLFLSPEEQMRYGMTQGNVLSMPFRAVSEAAGLGIEALAESNPKIGQAIQKMGAAVDKLIPEKVKQSWADTREKIVLGFEKDYNISRQETEYYLDSVGELVFAGVTSTAGAVVKGGAKGLVKTAQKIHVTTLDKFKYAASARVATAGGEAMTVNLSKGGAIDLKLFYGKKQNITVYVDLLMSNADNSQGVARQAMQAIQCIAAEKGAKKITVEAMIINDKLYGIVERRFQVLSSNTLPGGSHQVKFNLPFPKNSEAPFTFLSNKDVLPLASFGISMGQINAYSNSLMDGQLYIKHKFPSFMEGYSLPASNSKPLDDRSISVISNEVRSANGLSANQETNRPPLASAYGSERPINPARALITQTFQKNIPRTIARDTAIPELNQPTSVKAEPSPNPEPQKMTAAAEKEKKVSQSFSARPSAVLPSPYKPHPLSRISFGVSADPKVVFEIGLQIPLQKDDGNELTPYINIGIGIINLLTAWFNRKKAEKAKRLSKEINASLKKLNEKLGSFNTKNNQIKVRAAGIVYKGDESGYIAELESFLKELQEIQKEGLICQNDSEKLQDRTNSDTRWRYRKKGVINHEGYDQLKKIHTKIKDDVHPGIKKSNEAITNTIASVKNSIDNAKNIFEQRKIAEQNAQRFAEKSQIINSNLEQLKTLEKKIIDYSKEDITTEEVLNKIKLAAAEFQTNADLASQHLAEMLQLASTDEAKSEIKKVSDYIVNLKSKIVKDEAEIIKSSQFLKIHQVFANNFKTLESSDESVLKLLIPFFENKVNCESIRKEIEIFENETKKVIENIDELIIYAPNDKTKQDLINIKTSTQLRLDEIRFSALSIEEKSNSLKDLKQKIEFSENNYDKKAKIFIDHLLSSGNSVQAQAFIKEWISDLKIRPLTDTLIIHLQNVMDMIVTSSTKGIKADEFIGLMEELLSTVENRKDDFTGLKENELEKEIEKKKTIIKDVTLELGKLLIQSESCHTKRAANIYLTCSELQPANPKWPAMLARYYSSRLYWNEAEEYLLTCMNLDSNYEIGKLLKQDISYDQYRLTTLYVELFQLFFDTISRQLSNKDQPRLEFVFKTLSSMLHMGLHPSLLREWLPNFIPTLFKSELLQKLKEDPNTDITKLSNLFGLFQRAIPTINEMIKRIFPREKFPVIRGISRLTAQGTRTVQTGFSLWSAGNHLIALKNKRAERKLQLLDISIGIPLTIINGLSSGITAYAQLEPLIGTSTAINRINRLNLHTFLGTFNSSRIILATSVADLTYRYHDYPLRLSHRWTGDDISLKNKSDSYLSIAMAALTSIHWAYQWYHAWFESKLDISMRCFEELLDTKQYEMAVKAIVEAKKAGLNPKECQFYERLAQCLSDLDTVKERKNSEATLQKSSALLEEAKKIFTSKTSLQTIESRIRRKQSDCFLVLNRFDEAEQVLMEIKPISGETYISLARIAMNREQRLVNNAISHLENAEVQFKLLYKKLLENDASRKDLEWAKSEAHRVRKCIGKLIEWQVNLTEEVRHDIDQAIIILKGEFVEKGFAGNHESTAQFIQNCYAKMDAHLNPLKVAISPEKLSELRSQTYHTLRESFKPYEK